MVMLCLVGEKPSHVTLLSLEIVVTTVVMFAVAEVNIYFEFCRDVDSENSLFSLSDVDFSLGGGETTVVSVTFDLWK